MGPGVCVYEPGHHDAARVAGHEHFGHQVIVTRKGAVRARQGDMGIIPGSMGSRSYIVRGRGNPEAFESCSHGAGRQMSRCRPNAPLMSLTSTLRPLAWNAGRTPASWTKPRGLQGH